MESFVEPTPVSLKEDQLFYVQQGQEAMKKALSLLEDKEGWKVEIAEVKSPWFKVPL